MKDLIARLEAATEGSDSLDREIAKIYGIQWSPDEDGQFGGYNLLPRRCHFSRSLDAALTLVPEGWSWQMADSPEAPFANVELWNGKFAPDVREVECNGNTPALALCIAALKARATEPLNPPATPPHSDTGA